MSIYIDVKRETIQYKPTEVNANMIELDESQELIEKMSYEEVKEFIQEKVYNILINY
jgi:hypothetical protein